MATTKEETKQIGVKVPLELNERLKAVARRESNGISAVCRRLLSEAVQREEIATASIERRV